MSGFAHHVVRLIEDLKRMTIHDDKQEALPPLPPLDDPRPPKRPWEDMSREGTDHLSHSEVRVMLSCSENVRLIAFLQTVAIAFAQASSS